MTILIRAPHFGDPVYHIDEQFYLVTGRAVLDGAIPYVDIWDRKPPGLFLVYAAIALLGGSGVEQYQAVAGIFAFATALTIFAIARHFVAWSAALGSAILYLASLEALAGGGGQAPVFYNLWISLAFLFVLRSGAARSDRDFNRAAIGAMLLCACALTVKQTAIVESCLFGCLLLWERHKRGGSPALLCRDALVYCVIGLAPWGLISAVFLWIGHFDAFFDATFLSILKKSPNSLRGGAASLQLLSILVAGLIALAAGGWWTSRKASGWPQSSRLTALKLWLVAAIGGFLLIPNFRDHYALPVMVPLVLIGGLMLGRSRVGLMCFVPVFCWTLAVVGFPDFKRTEIARQNYRQAVSLLRTVVADGCLYVFQGPPLLYDATRPCRITPYLFPGHINNVRERDALPVAPLAELRRILDQRPNAIVTGEAIPLKALNPVALALLQSELRAHYRQIAQINLPIQSKGERVMTLWARTKRAPVRPAAQPGLRPINAASPDHPR